MLSLKYYPLEFIRPHPSTILCTAVKSLQVLLWYKEREEICPLPWCSELGERRAERIGNGVRGWGVLSVCSAHALIFLKNSFLFQACKSLHILLTDGVIELTRPETPLWPKPVKIFEHFKLVAFCMFRIIEHFGNFNKKGFIDSN